MGKCKECTYYGTEKGTISKTVYSPLVEGYITLEGYGEAVVCNLSNTSIILENRVDGCRDFNKKRGKE